MCAVCDTILAGNADTNGLLSGTQWAITNLTYSFPTSAVTYGNYYAQGEPTRGFQAFTAKQQAVAIEALDLYSAVSNLSFTRVIEGANVQGDLRFAQSSMPTTAWAYLPTTADAGGDVWLGTTRGYYVNPALGNYGFYTIAHEIGHALGLKHPHATGGFGKMSLDFDQIEYTIMSYRSYEGADVTKPLTIESWGFPQSLMMFDIAAIQQMYGADFSIATDTVYSWNPWTGEQYINGVGQGAPGANRIFMTVWAGHSAGKVTYDFSNYSTNLSVDLQPGAWTITSTAQLANLGAGHYADGNIANALLYNGDTRSLVENANGGSGNDTIVGNVIDNVIFGNAGSDKLYGLIGNDTFYGGAGNDFIDGGYNADTVVFGGARANYLIIENNDHTWTVKDLRSGSPNGTDTLKSIEVLKFSDQQITIASPDLPPPVHNSQGGNIDPALVNTVQAAAAAILRTTLSADQAASDASKLASGLSFNAYVAQLVAESHNSTIPALIVYDYVLGTTPGSAHLDLLSPFVLNQIMSPGYQATNNPTLGGYEAMGLGLAGVPEFVQNFSSSSADDFIVANYTSAFNRAPTALQIEHFEDQLSYFENLYLNVGIDPITAALGARGAVLGQIIGVAAEEPGNALTHAAENFLVAVANGQATYGTSLLGPAGSGNFADAHWI